MRIAKLAAFFAVGFLVVFSGMRWWKHDHRGATSCATLPDIRMRNLATASLAGSESSYYWKLHVESINDVPGFYLLKKIKPALVGVETPLLVSTGDGPVDMRSQPTDSPSIEIESSDAFAVIDARSNIHVDGRFPVDGESEVIQVPGDSVGRVSHLASDGIQNAVDIKAPIGALVRAMRPGRVAYVEQRFPDAGCDSPALLHAGNKIIVVDDQGFEVVYGHLKYMSALVTEGATVSAGDPIAAVGNSGKSVVPHLHIHAGGLTLAGYRTLPLRFRACDGGSGPALAPVLGVVHCEASDLPKDQTARMLTNEGSPTG